MGAALRKAIRPPVALDSWESLEAEAMRLERSLRTTVKEGCTRGTLGSIHSQVRTIRGALEVCAKGDSVKVAWTVQWIERIQDYQQLLRAQQKISLTPIQELEERLL
jgi:hypothetical protein